MIAQLFMECNEKRYNKWKEKHLNVTTHVGAWSLDSGERAELVARQEAFSRAIAIMEFRVQRDSRDRGVSPTHVTAQVFLCFLFYFNFSH